MAEENPLREFLVKEVPEWDDDDFARARFKAFTGQKQDWEPKLNFWKDLIIKVARHLDVLVIDTQAVQEKWFLRDGVVPMGLPQVLTAMKQSGELDAMEQVLGSQPSNIQWIGRILKKAVLWAGLQVLPDSYVASERPVEERLVVLPVLQEKIVRFLTILKESHFSPVYIGTLARIKELCGGSEEAELVIGRLLIRNKALFVNVSGGDPIEGFKISLNESPVASVLETDQHMLQLQWTTEMLQIRLKTLDARILTAKSSAIRSVKAGYKREALRYVRSMKLLQLSREKCAGSMDKIEQVLDIVADAETTKKVSEALKVSVAAIKENHVSLEEVHHTLSELDEAITLQKETEEALTGAPTSSAEVDDEAALDEELASLEEEMEAENLSLPDVPKVPVVKLTDQDPSTAQRSEEEDVELDKEFAKLALELG